MVTKTSGSGWTSAVKTTRPEIVQRRLAEGLRIRRGRVSATVVTGPAPAGVDAEDLIEALVEAARR